MVAWFVRASVFSFSRIWLDRTVDRIPAWAMDELIALTKKAYSISASWMLRTCVMALWFIEFITAFRKQKGLRGYL